jgi:hypothetical protein
METARLAFTRTTDPASARELREILGHGRVKRFGQSHPYGDGFRALAKRDKGEPLSVIESNALAVLVQDSDLLMEHKQDWSDHREHLSGDIRSSRECESLRFELWTIRNIAKASCLSANWLRYSRPTEPDVLVSGPTFGLECKLITEATQLDRIRQVLHENYQQHRHIQMPYVMSVGFAQNIEQESIVTLPYFLADQKDWFERHPRLSALVVRTPSGFRPRRRFAGSIVLTDFEQGSIASCLNWKAEHPLPRDFRFSPPGSFEMNV